MAVGDNREVTIDVNAKNECNDFNGRFIFSVEESRVLDITVKAEDPICHDDSIFVEVVTNEGSLQDWVTNQDNIYVEWSDSIQGDIYARYIVDHDTLLHDDFNIREVQMAYGDRGYRYMHLEAGIIGQRLNLSALELDYGVSGIGGFFDDVINKNFSLPKGLATAYITVIGRPATPIDPRVN